jgi:hypothetical protein
MIIFRHERAADHANPASVVEIRIESADLNAGELVEYFAQFMLAAGYQPQTVAEALGAE